VSGDEFLYNDCVRPMCLVGILSLVGCSRPSTLVSVEVTSGDSASAAITSATISLFDGYGLLGRKVFAPAALPGEAMVRGLPDRSESVRVAVVGAGGNEVRVVGGAKVTVAPHTEAIAMVVLAARNADSDGDGVPDAIDDCPSVFDPDQQNSAGSGPGDACRMNHTNDMSPKNDLSSSSATDAAMNDLSSGGATDAGQPVCGSPCTTPNPGACATGTWVCNASGAASCVPNVTTQSCYTGPASTSSVGICSMGTQSCIGTLGPCNGEVLPAAIESCFNNLDDDCDGTINNGCPIAIATGTPRALTARGDPSGGNPYSARCPANSYVTKTAIYVDTAAQWISGVALTCATPTLVTGTNSSVTLTLVTPQPYISIIGSGTSGSAVGSDDCGTSGFSAGWYVSGTFEAGSGLDSFGMSCATGSSSFLPATNRLSFSFSRQSPSTIYTAFNGGTQFEDDCMSNEVLIGYDGRDGNWLDELRGVCAPLTAVYK
jgi:hypothetical protein